MAWNKNAILLFEYFIMKWNRFYSIVWKKNDRTPPNDAWGGSTSEEDICSLGKKR